MKDNKLVAAQIGCGKFAECQDLVNLSNDPRVKLKWCCDLSMERTRAMADKFGAERATVDFMDAINDPEVDFIKIATTHDARLSIIRAAAERKIHIFCEKPMATHEEEAWEIMRLVRASGVKFCVDLNRRMAPALHALRRRWLEQRRNPRRQPWRFVEVERAPLPEETYSHLLINIQDESASYRLVHLDPAKGGGVIIGESVHWLDLARWFFAPAVPIEIIAWGSPRMSHGINLKFSNGDSATLSFSCAGTFDYPKETYEVTADAALFRSLFFVENAYYGVPGLTGETFPLQFDALPEIGTEGGFTGYMAKHRELTKNAAGNGKSVLGKVIMDKGHWGMMDGFISAILDDKPTPCDELDGYISMFLAKQAIRSIETRQALPITPDKLTPCLV